MHTKVLLRNIQIYSGIFSTLCNPHIFTTLPCSFLFFFYFVFFISLFTSCVTIFELNIYLIKSPENTHIWLQFVAKMLVWNLRQRNCLKSIKNKIETHTHTHTNTHNKKGFQLQKLLKKHTFHINMFKHLK